MTAHSRSLGLEGFFGQAAWTDVILTANLPRLFEEPPDLPDRLRGALGRALERQAALRSPWTKALPSAWDLLFGGRDETRSYVIRSDRAGFTLTVTVRLIGRARPLAAEVAHAMIDALAVGVAIRARARHDVSIPVLRRRVIEHTGLRWTGSPVTALARFSTPLCLRTSGGELSIRPHDVADALTRRICAVANLQGLSLAGSDAARRPPLNLEPVTAHEVAWRRNSSTPVSHGMPIRGYVGDFRVHRPSDAVWRLLRLAEIFHLGGMTSMGLGRFELLRL